MEVPILDLKRQYRYLKSQIDHRLQQALDHQRWIMGPEVQELEQTVARYIGTQFAVGVASGTDALVLALRALAYKRTGSDFWKPAAEIITTPFTFAATADAILRAGATPVFVDIDPETFNINPERIENALTKNTVGIIPVHLYGRACPMAQLKEIAQKHNLFILEDVAQAFGASYQGKKCGAWGDAAAFSFFPSKNLGGFGDGGIVTTDDQSIAEFVDILRRHGGKDKYNVDYLGYNSRLDTLQAAILLARFSVLEEFNARRLKVAANYNRAFSSIPHLTVPRLPANGEHVFHQYTIRHPERDLLKQHLDRAKVATMVYYPIPLHKMKLFATRCRIGGELKEAERAAREVLSLPIEPLLEPEEVDFVIKRIEEYSYQRQTVSV
ncbi:MAG: DegT/DnrJ/EryC1/StrS family aminotransferase [candidate division WOR-3 bacterium]|jgi:dTDP-4-amino-4,6-dideoxygalactose transaminase|nr:DegT/DnrJ/EryC1/StrS family aminotransferase [candidate division WOR-3 bacterium]MCR4423977.1 DegT/DnrJ/EryC1/StrS family aminotransferase [candidate division WOR-3 bacterium]MDH7519604.1 DegT/DnrJ/EryC1/StrS family aminotransferase [bacterium]